MMNLKVRIQIVLLFLFSFLVIPAFTADEKNPPVILVKKQVTVDFDDVVPEENGIEKKDEHPLRIAVAAMISPKSTYTYYISLLKLIGKELGKDVNVIQKKTYAEVNDMLREKKIDIAFVCSGPYVMGKRSFGMEIVAVPVCNGEKVYYSYFIARRSSGFKSFDCFRGRTFAFTDPLSNTGYLVPVYYVKKKNEEVKSFFKSFFFSHSHDNSIKAVADGLAEGAAVDSLIYEFFIAKNPKIADKVVVVQKSDPYGMPPVVVHPDMNMQFKKRIREVFYKIHKNPAGRKFLDNLRIDRFEAGKDRDYDSVRELLAFINRQ